MNSPKVKSHAVCSVVGCKNSYNNTNGVKFYNFPSEKKDPGRRSKWVNAVKRINIDGTPWEPGKTARVCSEHFAGGRAVYHPEHPAYIPSIFPSIYGKKDKSLTSLDRYERVKRRRQAVDTRGICSSNMEDLHLEVGVKFRTYSDLRSSIKRYEQENFVQLWKSTSRTIDGARKKGLKRSIEDDLRYVEITYRCIHSGQYKSRSKGQRPNQKSIRQNCEAMIRIRASSDGKNLEVVENKEVHNHELNQLARIGKIQTCGEMTRTSAEIDHSAEPEIEVSGKRLKTNASDQAQIESHEASGSSRFLEANDKSW